EPALTYLQSQIYNDFVKNFQRLQANLSPRPIGPTDIPPELHRKFISDRGRFLLHIHPAVDIWDREGALRFVTELRSVDPEVTGTPIITFEAIRFMERAYQRGTVYAILLVSFVTALMLRRAREILLALLPLALGVSAVTNETRSEEHTSELQSRFDLVCRLLLEKKKYRTSPTPLPHPPSTGRPCHDPPSSARASGYASTCIAC